MASSSTMRGGRLLSSAMGRGTALGSTLNAPRWAAPGVVALPEGCFMGGGVASTEGAIHASAEALIARDEDCARLGCESRVMAAAVASARESAGPLGAR